MTPSQERVLRALRAVSRDGWPSTVREVADALGLAGSTAHVHLVELERQGQARRHPRSEKGGWLPA